MSATATVVERTAQAAGTDTKQILFRRKAIDPDAALLARLRRGEEGAAEALVGAYGDRVYRLAIRITSNASDAEEVVQDTLWTVSRKIDSFRGEAAFGSWVYRITANTAYEKLRQGRARRSEVSWDELAPVFDEKGQHAEVVVDWSRRLKDPAIERELKSVLSAAIDELPPEHRTAFLLHDVEGLSNSEIAEAQHVNPGTVKSRVHRARLFLRRCLADYMDASLEVARI
jgi:RNA polymerase sigma-70 factor (ECF subfamily)